MWAWWHDSRFNPAVLLRGHKKGLSDYRKEGRPKPDRLTLWGMRVIALLAGVLVFFCDVPLTASAPLLAAVALLAGGMLTAFTHLSTLRKTYTDRASSWSDAERIQRDFLDETAAHLLTGSYTAAWCAASLVVAMNSVDSNAPDGPQHPQGILAAVPVSLATYLFLIFIVAIPRMYIAYVELNDVRDELAGTHKDSKEPDRG